MVLYEESDLHRMLRGQARNISSRILREDGPAPQREGGLPLRRFHALKETGYPGILIPIELEGEGGGWTEAAIVTEELSSGEPVLAMMLLSHLLCTAGLLRWADDHQARDFLPPLARSDVLGTVALTEPEAGTDFTSLRASIERRGDTACASGNKCFVTNTAPGEESGVLTFLRGHDGIAAAYIPSSSPGLHLAHHYRFSGWEGLPNHALVLQDCCFPAAHVLSEGLDGEDLLPLFDGAALLVTAMAAGMARTCLEEASRYTQEREQGGKRLDGHQALLFRLADMATYIELIKTSLYLAAARLDTGESCHRELCMLKLFASGKLEEIASSAMEMAGGYGYTLDCRLSSLHRDAKGLQLFWGTRELMRLEIARELEL
jgi:alkylation response protein AidB-like acyl-CoA dehydrogenase